jgi:ribonuclease P protein component
MIANWRALPTGSKARLGVITTKALGNAVIRARVRRLLREAWRLHQHELNQAVDMVLVAHRSIVGRKFAEVEGDYVTALRRAGLLKTS